MKLEDEFKLLVGAYYGVEEMDEYALKVYVLKDIEDLIKRFIEISPISGYDYEKMALKFKEEVPLKTKLQDSLIILNRINGPIELILLIKNRIKELN